MIRSWKNRWVRGSSIPSWLFILSILDSKFPDDDLCCSSHHELWPENSMRHTGTQRSREMIEKCQLGKKLPDEGYARSEVNIHLWTDLCFASSHQLKSCHFACSLITTAMTLCRTPSIVLPKRRVITLNHLNGIKLEAYRLLSSLFRQTFEQDAEALRASCLPSSKTLSHKHTLHLVGCN